jgi:uncharacterized damage-inducible protein DinB
MAPIDLWLAAIDDTRRRTLRLLDELPEWTLDWPDVDGATIGSLLYHMAAIEVDWLYVDVLGELWPAEIEPLFPLDVRDEEGHLSAMSGESLASHRQRLAAVRELLREAYQRMTPADFVTPRELEEYVVTPAWVIHHLMQHEAEHRGQIMMLRDRALAAAE